MAIQTSRRQFGLVLIVLAVVLSFHRCSDSNETKKALPTTPAQPMDATQVKKLYNVKCGICHGEDGKLNYAGAKDISVSTMSIEAIAAQIKYGKGTMPPQKDILTDDEISALADYSLMLRTP